MRGCGGGGSSKNITAIRGGGGGACEKIGKLRGGSCNFKMVLPKFPPVPSPS